MTVALSDLDAFAAVARLRSFRRAAAERGVSPSLLSQTVRRLEAQLGVQLLHRTTRSVTPTQAGEELLAGLLPAFAGIAQAVDRLNGHREGVRGRLRINAPQPAAQLLLGPLIAGFLGAHPKVELEIAVDDALVDVLGEGFDAGVRFGEDLPQDMIAVPMGGLRRMLVVASPSCVAAAGVPATPRHLPLERLVRHRFPGGSIQPWSFRKGGESISLAPAGPLTVNDSQLELRAALDGVGFAYVFEGHARPAIEAGQLVSVLDDWSEPFPPAYLYYSSRRHTPAPLRALIQHLQAVPAA